MQASRHQSSVPINDVVVSSKHCKYKLKEAMPSPRWVAEAYFSLA
jgi:hypothetical protein